MAVDAEDSKNRILDGRRVLQVPPTYFISSHSTSTVVYPI